MKKTLKKGFTIVELVIVIAVIAILTAVLVPTISSVVKKANVSADTQLVRNLNTALKEDEALNGSPKTMQAALDVAAADGYDIAKINAKAKDNKILWDSVNNVFAYLKDGAIEYIPNSVKDSAKQSGYKLWTIASEPSEVYSTYLYNATESVFNSVKTGIDIGNENVTSIKYVGNTAAQDVVIRTKGDQCVLTIDKVTDNVDFYGYAKEINVGNVASESLHIYGSTNKLAVETGHVEIEETGIVFDIVQIGAVATGEGATVTNNGYVAATTLVKHTTEVQATAAAKVTGTAVGGDYEIDKLSKLEAFRDAVNSGNTFNGKAVKLTADITLKDGWTPIGEASRKPSSTATEEERASKLVGADAKVFRGEFNGNGKTISNLNNKGFTPTPNRIGIDGSQYQYAYGLFGFVASGANIHDINLRDVNIDIKQGSYENKPLVGDSVGAAVGYAFGNVTIANIKVWGKVSAGEGVGGIIGRGYPFSEQSGHSVDSTSALTISGCENHAAVSGTSNVAGILGYFNTKGKTVTMTSNTNDGTISNVTNSASIVCYQNEKSGTFNYNGTVITSNVQADAPEGTKKV